MRNHVFAQQSARHVYAAVFCIVAGPTYAAGLCFEGGNGFFNTNERQRDALHAQGQSVCGLPLKAMLSEMYKARSCYARVGRFGTDDPNLRAVASPQAIESNINEISNDIAACRSDKQVDKGGNPDKGCNGGITTSEYQSGDRNCLTINNQCGFKISAKLGSTQSSAYKGSTDVGAQPVTMCSVSASWKYYLKGYTRQRY